MLLIWMLALFSPLVAILCAVSFYARHCRERPDPERRVPALAYAFGLLICAIVAYFIGMILGAEWACSDPSTGNLCGLEGVFVIGPLASTLTAILVGSLITLLPSGRTPPSRHN